MSLRRLVTTLLLSICWLWFVAAAEEHVSKPPHTSVKPVNQSSGPTVNSTVPRRRGGDVGGFSVDSSMIQRALYVLIGITLTGMLYFLIRAVRLKKPAPKKKYGLLTNYDDSVEMEAAESEEDDTLYEARSLRR
ncbi:unnamed protein product [Knipowitschia caucasica]|uniref:Uncharacterized protein n=1 Tax=Knipowitschia caucasica TaxID=637954 RepID=A0AAV2KTQ5_KNICA